jgi:hypothetical protein
MLQILSGFPDNVIAVRASGKVLGEEYRSVLIPVDKEKRKTHEKLNLGASTQVACGKILRRS